MLNEFDFVDNQEKDKLVQRKAVDQRDKKLKQSVLGNNKKLKEQKSQMKKEESLREVLGFFINQVDEKKYQKKKTKNKNVEYRMMEGDEAAEEDEIIQDEFLNQNEFAEIKGNYDDLGLGDLVIVFPNPDYHETQDKPIDFKKAEKIFDEVLTVLTDEGISKSQAQKERDSFLLAFLTLNQYKEKEDKKKKKKQKKEAYKDDLDSAESKRPQNEGKTDKTSYEKYQEIEHLITKQQQAIKEREQKQKQAEEQAERGIDAPIAEPNYSKEQFQNIDPIKELLKVNLKDVSQFSRVQKAYCGGGFLYKKVYEDDDFDWVCTNSQPKDFLTLVRFTVMAKLCRNGNLHTRSFLSSDSKQIFMVIKSNKAVVMKQAENMKINKQLELGYADLFSLEPCDESFRPLRLKNYIRDYLNDQELKNRLEKMMEYEEETKKEREQIYDYNASQNIEYRAKIMYKKVINWDAIELRANVIKKQAEVDKYMKKMAKDLNFDMSHEKVELIDDRDISREEWEAYYIYMEYIDDFMKRIEKLEKFDEIKMNQAFLYKLIFRKAVGDSNEIWFERHPNLFRTITGQMDILHTLWDRLNVPPISPYTDFFNPNNESGSSMWRKYQINEKNLRSEFINMEKIKITHTIVNKNINVLKLIKEELAVAYFPIHDPYQLKGQSKESFFQALHEGGLMNKTKTTTGEEELKKLFQEMADEAEATDFDAESLEEEAKFNFRIPWSIPIDSMRDYFGEKIALYFNFLKYYTKQLWYMAILGVIAQIMIDLAENKARNIMIVIFSICIIMWSTFFIEFWKREQVLFSVQFGQQEFEEEEAERPAFVGQYVRSITNDDLNEEFYSPFRRKMKMLLSLVISMIIISMVIVSVIGIFTLRSYLSNNPEYKDKSILVTTIPGLLNSIQIQIFNTIYEELGMIFNNFENHKILSSYENSLIAKNFIFMFVNTFNSFFIISFMNQYFKNLNLCGATSEQSEGNCFLVLQNQMTIIFLVTFVKNVPEIVQPLVKAFINKQSKEIDEKPVVHPFNKIDYYIEEQLELEPYATSDEVDGTVGDYMELVIQFSFLALFGLAFPLSYFLAFITNVAEIQVDKLKLTKFSQRPFPQGASNIGNWLVILEVITFFGIFSNAGLIVYTSKSIDSDQIITFSVLLVTFLAIKYFIRFIIPDVPESAMILNKRHQYAVDRVVKGFAKSRTKQYKPARVNLNIGGVIYDEKPKDESPGPQSQKNIDQKQVE